MENNDLKLAVFNVVAYTFNIDVTALSMTTVADDVDGWDSLAHATLILRLEKKFNVTLDPFQACAAQNLQELVDLIRRSISD
jgi:acyl carrier protein